MTNDLIQDSRLAYACAERLLLSLPKRPTRKDVADRLAHAAAAVLAGDAQALMRAAITALAMAEQALEIREALLAREIECDSQSQ